MINNNLIGYALLLPLAFLYSSILTASPLIQIGKITKIQGSAIESPTGLSKRNLSLGSMVHKNSEIKTGKNARLEITFSDKSKIILGEWAHLKLNKHSYTEDNNHRNDHQSLNIITGTFRLITGLIAKSNKFNVNVRTPVATIGIRGTDIFGGPLAAGMPPGEIHYGFMSITGAIAVINRHGVVTLDQPNEGTFLPMTGRKAPTPPTIWSEEAIDEAFASITFN